GALPESDDPKEVEQVPGYADLIVDPTSLPVGFELDFAHSGPTNRFGEGAPHEVPGGWDPDNYRRINEKERGRQVGLGLVGGYQRNFVKPQWVYAEPSVMIGVNEFLTGHGARDSMSQFDFEQVQIEGIPDADGRGKVDQITLDESSYELGYGCVTFNVG